MATEIKAIPTLYGEDAFRFREDMERADEEISMRPARNREEDPFVRGMREMPRRSGF